MAVAAERLSGQDLANLLVEAQDTPMHMAVLTIFQGAGAQNPPPELLRLVREHVRTRLAALPELQRVLKAAGFPGRRPAWQHDRSFDVEHQVLAAEVSAPGGEEQLLALVGDLMESVLDRSRPLWELWVLTGLAGDRWATLLKVHHSLTDGYGMLRIALELFDGSPDEAVPAPEAAGTARERLLRLVLAPPALVTTIASVVHRTWHGHRADLLHPIGDQRRVEVVRLDLAEVRERAHAHDAKVNDVLLELAAAGIRAALTGRGQPVAGTVLRALMAVSPSATRRTVTHNRAASIVVSLPLGPDSAADRLRAIAADSRRARRWQRSGVIERAMVFVARTRLRRLLSRHQRVVDLAVSNLVGPRGRLRLLGDPMVEAIPITPISGNVTINFCALSYAGRLAVGILADAAAWPDLPRVAAAMRADAAELGPTA